MGHGATVMRCVILLALATVCVTEDEAHNEDGHDHHMHCQTVQPSPSVFQNLAQQQQQQQTRRKKRAATTAQPLRITPIYDSTFYNLSNYAYVKTIIQQSVLYFRRALLVRQPSTSPVYLARTCATSPCRAKCPFNCNAAITCLEVNVAQKYLQSCDTCSNGVVVSTVGGGVSNTDYLLFISAIQTSQCSSGTIAYATFCNIDSSNWRPNVGSLNLCPSSISNNNLTGYDPVATYHIITHEITHALGFISSLFPFFRDDNGNPLTPVDSSTNLPPYSSSGYLWSSNVTVTKSVAWQTAKGYVTVNKTYMVTPTVRSVVRQFFNCSTLIGAELEDQGGSGTALSHWEKRIFVNEYMAGVISEDMYISSITLALLQDTGWYYANFSMAEPYSWAQGLGCSFATDSCLTWIKSQTARGQNPFPFCNTFDMWSSETRTTCDPQQSSVRTCNLQIYASTLASSYAYFNQTIANSPNSYYGPANYGGSIYLADYCPYYQEVINTLSKYPTGFSKCSNSYAAPQTLYNGGLQSFGAGSLCLRQATPNFLFQCNSWTHQTIWGSGCYTVSCSNTAVTVTVNGQTLTCTSEYQRLSWTPSIAQLSVSGFSYTPTLVSGAIYCPLCSNACPNQACPMQRVSVNSTTLINTDQSSSAVVLSSAPSNRPCNAQTITSTSGMCGSCSSNATCVTVGSSYYCVCQSGYYGNGVSCTAVNTLNSLVLQTNISLPINIGSSTVLNPTSSAFLSVKNQLETLFSSALSVISTYQPGSLTVQQLYSGSLVVQTSAVYASSYSSQSTDAPNYLETMNAALVNVLNEQGTSCTIGSFTNVNCSQASSYSSYQSPCANSACPSGTVCSESSQYQYVCTCLSSSTTISYTGTVQLQGCNVISSTDNSKNSATSFRNRNFAALLVLIACVFAFAIGEKL